MFSKDINNEKTQISADGNDTFLHKNTPPKL